MTGAVLILAGVGLARAQEGPPVEWTPIVELRARALPSSGLVDGDALTVGQRARLGIQIERGWLTARVSFQELRSWSTAEDIVQGAFIPGVAEGWARVDAALSDEVGVRVTVGRQPIRIDDGRLVGDRAWEMQGQFLDAVRIEGRVTPIEIEYVNARRFDAATGEDPLGFGVNVVRVGVGREMPVAVWKLDGVSIVDARRTEQTTATFGGYTRVDLGRWRSTVELYLQSNPAGAGLLGSASAGWVFGPDESTLVRSRVTTVSGDPDGDGPRAAFVPLLGETHTFLGLLDHFGEAGGSAPGDDGLGATSLGVTARPWRALEASADALYFVSPVRRAPYGGEIDVALRWWFSPFGTVAAGFAHFEPAPRADEGRIEWGYLDLDVAF